jgi:MFS family permease
MDIGAVINQYQIVEHIGRGGMADVWSARDQRLSRMVAIKTIAHGLITDQNMDPVAMFKKEAQTIAQMEHPHVLPIYDFGEHQGKLYIVMRYMTGGSLDRLLSSGPLPLPEAMRMGRAVAQALDYAHQNSVIHLDLKPQNILLDSQESPYLADFGLATALDREGRAANPGSGTLMYMAPEQMTSDVLDKRADIYSFCIVMYHILSGSLPFDGLSPLAMKQLQFQEDLPVIGSLPAYVTEVLRRGASLDPTVRYNRVMAVIEELETVLSDTVELAATHDTREMEPAPTYRLIDQIESSDAELLEVVDLYSRAHAGWIGGQGKFLLGVTHFMLINDYYMQAARYGLTLDLEGTQLLLRGALEYDRDIEYWWRQLDDSSRRWVCLHAIRSANAPARVRALYRLEILPDTDPPRIPRLVAQALQLETDEQARLAALQVLSTRARLMKPTPRFAVMTEYQGRLLTTFTRLEMQELAGENWQEVVYSPEIDHLIAEIALDPAQPPVAEFAARVIGRIHSLAAVNHLAEEQRKGRSGALQALALVRDEAATLPRVVSPRSRAYAWLTNTWRRITADPLALTWRFLLAVLGGSLGMGWQVYVTFRSEQVFAPQRLANTLAFGLTFGLFIGVLTVLAEEIPSRLRGFWLWWSRMLLSAVTGFALGTLTWGMVLYFFYQQTSINWDLMRFGGFFLALGLVLTTMLNLRGWLAVAITTLLIYFPLYSVYHNNCLTTSPIFGGCPEAPPFSIAPMILVALALGLLVGVIWRVRARTVGSDDDSPGLVIPPLAQLTFGALAGLLWASVMWLFYSTLPQQVGTKWTALTVMIGLSILFSALAVYLLRASAAMTYALSAVTGFAAFYSLIGPMVQVTPQNRLFQIVSDPSVVNLLLDYKSPMEIFTASLPMALLIALGMYAMLIARDLRQWTGQQERAPMTEGRAMTMRLPAAPGIAAESPPPAASAQDRIATQLVRKASGERLINAPTQTVRAAVDSKSITDRFASEEESASEEAVELSTAPAQRYSDEDFRTAPVEHPAVEEAPDVDLDSDTTRVKPVVLPSATDSTAPDDLATAQIPPVISPPDQPDEDDDLHTTRLDRPEGDQQ